MHPTDMIRVPVRDRDHIEMRNSAFPQIGRHHVFAEIEFGLLPPTGPPASTSGVLPSGETTSSESPWPTSIAVTSIAPGRICGFGTAALTHSPATVSRASPDAASAVRRQASTMARASAHPAITMVDVSGIATR